MCVGHDHSSPGIESQVTGEDQTLMSNACGRGSAVTRSVWPRSSIKDSLSSYVIVVHLEWGGWFVTVMQHYALSSSDGKRRPVRRLSADRRRPQQGHGQQTHRADTRLSTEVVLHALITTQHRSRTFGVGAGVGQRLIICNECKKLQFIHTVNGDGSKTAKNHKKAMLTTLT